MLRRSSIFELDPATESVESYPVCSRDFSWSILEGEV